MPALSQEEAAMHIYGTRAEQYNDSWHPGYATRFVRAVVPLPGQRILDLCCGTGVDMLLVAEALAERGSPRDGGVVVGIDVSPEMLSVAKAAVNAAAAARPALKDHIQVLKYNVASLPGLQQLVPGLDDNSFDSVMCSCALTLFDDPGAVVRGWRRLLKPPGRDARLDPGGALVVDIPHEAALQGGLIMERVARRLGLKYPSNRSWVTSVDSFRGVLERSGFRVERVAELDNTSGRGARVYSLRDAAAMFRAQRDSTAFEAMLKGAPRGSRSEEYVRHACALFYQEFCRRAGPSGRIYESDAMYIYTARRTS